MPELADVEGFKRYVARYAEKRRIRRVRVSDAQVLRNTSPGELRQALRGRRIGHPRRHGKWLMIPVGDGRLVLHFGMTGGLKWTSRASDPDKVDRLVLEVEGGELRYRSQRKLGGVWWVPPEGQLAGVTGQLGPDAAELSREELHELFARRRGLIKAELMNQRLLAGIGNELSDEILWRAQVRPDACAQDLGAAEVDGIYDAMRDVLRRSMRRGRIPHVGRWLNAVRGRDRPRCPRCGAEIKKMKVTGRTAYFCPRCQQ